MGEWWDDNTDSPIAWEYEKRLQNTWATIYFAPAWCVEWVRETFDMRLWAWCALSFFAGMVAMSEIVLVMR